jgi:hypothetical protein
VRARRHADLQGLGAVVEREVQEALALGPDAVGEVESGFVALGFTRSSISDEPPLAVGVAGVQIHPADAGCGHVRHGEGSFGEGPANAEFGGVGDETDADAGAILALIPGRLIDLVLGRIGQPVEGAGGVCPAFALDLERGGIAPLYLLRVGPAQGPGKNCQQYPQRNTVQSDHRFFNPFYLGDGSLNASSTESVGKQRGTSSHSFEQKTTNWTVKNSNPKGRLGAL